MREGFSPAGILHGGTINHARKGISQIRQRIYITEKRIDCFAIDLFFWLSLPDSISAIPSMKSVSIPAS
jgi:hypothetical protein